MPTCIARRESELCSGARVASARVAKCAGGKVRGWQSAQVAKCEEASARGGQRARTPFAKVSFARGDTKLARAGCDDAHHSRGDGPDVDADANLHALAVLRHERVDRCNHVEGKCNDVRVWRRRVHKRESRRGDVRVANRRHLRW